MKISVLLLCLCSITAVDAAASTNGDELISFVDKHEDGYVDLSANIKMILTDATGSENNRYMRFFSIESEKIGEKRKFVFRSPRDIKGTAILIHSEVVEEDKQWIYLPAFKRVKRVSSNNRKTAFVGSEFTYEDLASQEKEKYTNKFLYEKTVDGIACYVVRRTPVFPASGYQYMDSFIDKKRARYIKTDYYDKHSKLLKTLIISDYKWYKNRYLLASTYTMTNHQTHKKTVMKWSDIKLQSGFSMSDFARNALSRTR